DDHQVGRLERFQAGDVLVVLGVDSAVGRVDGEQDGTLETVVLGEDLGQLLQRFLGAVLVVAAYQDDVYALAGAVAAVVNVLGLVGGPHGAGQRQRQHGDGKQSRGGHDGAFLSRWRIPLGWRWPSYNRVGRAERN